MGNEKSTRLEDIEYDIANLETETAHIRTLYENYNRLSYRVKKIEDVKITNKENLLKAIRELIREWLKTD